MKLGIFWSKNQSAQIIMTKYLPLMTKEFCLNRKKQQKYYFRGLKLSSLVFLTIFFLR